MNIIAARDDRRARRWLGQLMAAAIGWLVPIPVAAQPCVGTALAFAIDASSSIDDQEYALQTGGIGHALRQSDVLEAIRGAGGVALAAVVWSDTAMTTATIGWTDASTPAGAERFARMIETLPRVGAGNTDIGNGLWRALDLLDDTALCALRRVVNVSGDGRETLYPRRRFGTSLLAARKRAEQLGVTINGLAIVDTDPTLGDYYQHHVAVGPGSFSMLAAGFGDFRQAIRAKLLREIISISQASLMEPDSIKASNPAPSIAKASTMNESRRTVAHPAFRAWVLRPVGLLSPGMAGERDRPSDSHPILLPHAVPNTPVPPILQVTVNAPHFPTVALGVRAGRKEMQGVQRPIFGHLPVSARRSTRLNPFEIKRKKGSVRALDRVR